MTTPLTFQEIQYHAACGRTIRRLAQVLTIHHPTDMAGPLGDLDADDYRRLGETVCGIEAVLTMLATTPNAHLNREALDALALPVQKAKTLLEEDWINELMRQADHILQDRTDDLPL